MVSRHYIVGEAAYFRIFDLDVRGYAAPVAHRASGTRVKHIGERVGSAGYRAVRIAVRVIDCLDEASARYVVALRGDLDDAVVGQGECRLHETLAVGAFADDYSAVEILKRTCDNLGRRG